MLGYRPEKGHEKVKGRRVLRILFLLFFAARSFGPAYAYAGEVSGEEVTIVMGGDMLMHDKVIKSGLKSDGSYDFKPIFKHVKSGIENADIAIINQETILGGEELKYSGYPSFNSPWEVGDAEAEAGFDVVLAATNHALDRGSKGIENCLGFWEKEHPQIEVLGIHDSEEDKQELCIIDTAKTGNKNSKAGKTGSLKNNCRSSEKDQGMRIAILNYTYGTNGIQMPKGKGYLVDYLAKDKVRADIERAEKEADFTIVCPHWGTEYSLEVSKEQERWAELFLECGADLCIGTHPHVIEPIEVLKDDRGHEMTVYYSLGNFVNHTSGQGKGVMNRMVGGLAEIRIGRDDKGGVKILESRVRPVVCHLSENETAAYFLEDYTEELAKKNLIRSQDPDFSLANCRKLTESVWEKDRIGSVFED